MRSRILTFLLVAGAVFAAGANNLNRRPFWPSTVYGSMIIESPNTGVITRGLAGWWLMGEGSGTAAQDISSNGRHGTLENMEAGDWGAAMGLGPGGALTFDGTADPNAEYITLAGAKENWTFITGTGIFTLATWISVADFTLNKWFIGNAIGSSYIGFSIGALTDKRIRIYSRNHAAQTVWGWTGATSTSGFFSGSNHIPDTNPHFLVIVGDGSNVYLYVDDMTTSVGSMAVNVLSTSAPSLQLNIGRSNHSSTVLPHKGRLGQMRIYDRALDAAERQAIKDGRG